MTSKNVAPFYLAIERQVNDAAVETPAQSFLNFGMFDMLRRLAAFPVTGPRDVVGDYPIGVLDDDLRAACMGALKISRETCRAFALTRSWEKSALQFIRQINQLRIGNFRKPCAM